VKPCLNCEFENPDDARYCARCRFTLDWEATEPKEEGRDPTIVTAPLPVPALELALGPGQARAQPGQSVRFEARVANRGGAPARATLSVAGPTASAATVQPGTIDLPAGQTGSAAVTIAVPHGTPAQTLPVDVYATLAGAATASVAARASLQIDAPPQPSVQRRPSRRGGLIAAAVIALLLAGGAGFVLLTGDGIDVGPVEVGGEDGIHGVAVASRACLHEGPDFSSFPRIEEDGHCKGPLQGEEVFVRCETEGTYQLSGPDEFDGLYADTGGIQVDESPPAC
jgi:hypothetical protein